MGYKVKQTSLDKYVNKSISGPEPELDSEDEESEALRASFSKINNMIQQNAWGSDYDDESGEWGGFTLEKFKRMIDKNCAAPFVPPKTQSQLDLEKAETRAQFAEDALAGMIRAAKLGGIDLSKIDYTNAGLSRAELEAWWEKRDRTDEAAHQARILKELKAEEKRRAAEDLKLRKEAALAKLTLDERKILGIK